MSIFTRSPIDHPRYRRLVFGLIVPVLSGGCATTAQPALDRWEIVGPLKPAPNVEVFVHDFEGSAGLVVDGLDETYIVGWPTYVITDENQDGLAAGIIWTHEGSVRLLPKPPGLRRMVRPEGVGDGRGGLHLIWGDSPDSLATSPTELWYAHFDGSQWDAREKLDDIRRGLWGFGTSLIRLASGDVLFLTQTGHIDRQLALFRLRHSRWTKTSVPTGDITSPGYLGVVEAADQVLVLAGVSADTEPGESDENSVFASRSSDGGVTWTPFQRVYRSRGRSAHYLRLTVTERPHGPATNILPVFLVWHTPMVRDDSLGVRRSLDGGVTWEILPSVLLPPSTRGVEAAATCDGALYVAAHMFPTDTSKLGVVMTTRWTPHTAHRVGTWNGVEMTGLLIARSPSFAVRPGQTPALVLGIVRQRARTTGDLMAITAYAVRKATLTRCEHLGVSRRTYPLPKTHPRGGEQ